MRSASSGVYDLIVKASDVRGNTGSQTLRFTAPVYIGDEVEAVVEVVAVDIPRRRLTLSTTCRNERGQPVVVGEALVMVDG